MTVILKLGRRVPKNMGKIKTITHKATTLLREQDIMWHMIVDSLKIAKKKYDSGKYKGKTNITFLDMQKDVEEEDTFNDIEWQSLITQGDKKAEEQEYNEALGIYKSIKNIVKQRPSLNNKTEDNPLKGMFKKSRIIDEDKLKEAYAKGLENKEEQKAKDVLLELGIMTHVEWVEDYHDRDKGLE